MGVSDWNSEMKQLLWKFALPAVKSQRGQRSSSSGIPAGSHFWKARQGSENKLPLTEDLQTQIKIYPSEIQ